MIVARAQFRLDLRERLCAPLARAGESPHVARVLRLDLAQSRGFRGDAFAQQFQVREVLGDGRDAFGARTAEVAVVSHHAADRRRVALIEQQFQLLLAPIHVGDLQLRGERAALVRDLTLRSRLLGLQPRKFLLGIDAAGAHRCQSLARRLNLQVRLFELAGEGVAPLRVRMDLLADRFDARAHLPELGLLAVDARGGGLKTDRAQQQYISCGNGNGRASSRSCYVTAAILRRLFQGPASQRRQVAYSVQ